MNNVNIKRFPPLGYACDEALNALCTNLSFSSDNTKKIMITSNHAGEGKSYIAINIMRTLAKLGKRVALVDADLRRSVMVSRYGLQFDVDRPVGLTHYLVGRAQAEDVLYATNYPGAYVVPVGRLTSSSLPMLSTPRLNRLFDGLAKIVDYVIVDAPPLGEIIDAAEIAKSCDGTLIVVAYDKVHRMELIGLKEQLEQSNCPILGTVLNSVELGNYMSKKYYYKYGYHKYGYGYYGPNDREKHSSEKKKK